MRIAIISDTHLSERTPRFADNARAALDWIGRASPDLIVHLGDITADGAAYPEELAFARDVFADTPARMRFLPGNHDIGDPPSVVPGHEEHYFRPAALAEYRRVFGEDYWSFEAEGWQIIGLNAQLVGLGGEEEQAQRDWLRDVLARSDAKLGVMLHKPLFRNGHGDTERHQRYLPLEERRDLTALWAHRDLRFVMAGHTHQHRRIAVDGTEHVWAPSSAYFIPDRVQERIGRKVVGAVLLELSADAHSAAATVPPGLVQHDLAAFPQLYPSLAERLALRGASAAHPDRPASDIEAGVARFFDTYRAAFEAYDTEAIVDHYLLPSYVASDATEVALLAMATREDCREGIERVLARHRELGVVTGRALDYRATELSPRLTVLDLSFEFRNAGNEPLYDFRGCYTLVRQGADWRIAAIAHNQIPRLLARLAEDRSRRQGTPERKKPRADEPAGLS
jgi:predicted phosphodiesterase